MIGDMREGSLVKKLLEVPGMGTSLQYVVRQAISSKSGSRGYLTKQTTSGMLNSAVKYGIEALACDVPGLGLETRRISKRAEGWFFIPSGTWIVFALGHQVDHDLVKLNAQHGIEGFDKIANRRNLFNYDQIVPMMEPHAMALVVDPGSVPREPKAWLCDVLGVNESDNQFLMISDSVPYADWARDADTSPRLVTIDF